MKKAQYERQDHTIKDLETGHRRVYKTINEAKRWSRKKQLELDRGLGQGSVRVAV